MSGYVCVYECMDCATVAIGSVKSSEPPGWGYDEDECEWVCPEHAGRLPVLTDD